MLIFNICVISKIAVVNKDKPHYPKGCAYILCLKMYTNSWGGQ